MKVLSQGWQKTSLILLLTSLPGLAQVVTPAIIANSPEFPTFLPAHAIDGNPVSDYAASATVPGAFMDFDFGAPKTFSKIVYTDRVTSTGGPIGCTGGLQDYTTTYRLDFATDAAFANIVGSQTRVKPAPTNTCPSVSGFVDTLNQAVPLITARYVRWTSVAVFGAGLGGGRAGISNIEFTAVPADAYQVRYFSNLAIGDSVINFSNTGGSSTDTGLSSGGAQNGDICANVYAYSPDEQLVSCCSCNITPNALNSLSVKNDLASNTLTPIIPSALVVKVITSPGGAACTASSAAAVTGDRLASGLLAWGSTIHALPAAPGAPVATYGVTETPFAVPSRLSDAEFTRMKQLCAFIRANGSGYGICKSCKVGGLGASSR